MASSQQEAVEESAVVEQEPTTDVQANAPAATRKSSRPKRVAILMQNYLYNDGVNE